MKNLIKIKLLISILLIAILFTTGIVYAKESEIIKYYNIKDKIEENITTSDDITIPFYSLEKENERYKVLYKKQSKEDLEKLVKKEKTSSMSYEKYVKNFYYDLASSIPEYINYTEYNDDYSCTSSGKLNLISIKASGKNYVAEYTGTLYGIEFY